MSFAAAFRGMATDGVPGGCWIPLLADVPDRQSRNGRPQRLVRREDALIPMPMFARLRDQIRKISP